MDRIFTTDGSCSGNPGPGSYAVCEWKEIDGKLHLIYASKVDEPHTTNNRMELSAILAVFKIAAASPEEDRFQIYSDSAYCINILKPGGWIETWSRNGWIKSNKKQTIENLDLIQELYNYRNKIFSKCQLIKVSGHAGDIKNEVTDAVATGNYNKLKKFVFNNGIKIDFS